MTILARRVVKLFNFKGDREAEAIKVLTGDARLEFLRNSARRLKMRERIERAG